MPRPAPRAPTRQAQPTRTLADLVDAPLVNDPGSLAMPMQPASVMAAEAQAPGMKPSRPRVKLADIALGAMNGFLAAEGNPMGLAYFRNKQDEAQNEREMSFARERWAQQLEAQRQERLAKASEPPAVVRDAEQFFGLPRDVQQRVIDYRNAMSPVLADITRPDGSVIRQQVPRSLPAPSQDDAVSELQQAVASGDYRAVAEFDEVFGAGAARRALGQ